MTTLTLIKNVDLDNQYINTLTFNSLQEQYDYFNSKADIDIAFNLSYSYLRNNNEIKIQANIDDIINDNYLMYNNGDKEYYSFITKKEYVNDRCTKLFIQTDVMQTYMFDYSLDECFVDREHQDRYTKDNLNAIPVFNTEEENINYGKEYKIETKKVEDNYNNIDYDIYFIHIITKEKLTTNVTGTTLDKLINTNIYHYVLPYGAEPLDIGMYPNKLYHKNTDGSYTRFGDPYSLLSEIGNNSNVLSIYYERYPAGGYELTTVPSIDGYSINFMGTLNSILPSLVNINGIDFYNIGTRNDGIVNLDLPFEYSQDILISLLNKDNLKNINYEPKLKIYPYNFYKLNFGNGLIIKNEYLTNNFKLEFYSSLCTDKTTMIRLKDYKLNEDNLAYNYNATSINSNEHTLRTDAWLEYELNNSASKNAGLVTAGLTTGIALAAAPFTAGTSLLAVGGIATSGALKIGSELAKRKDIKNKPDDVRQTTAGLGISQNLSEWYILCDKFSITDEYKNKLFEYFYHYGYKVSDFKIPNTNSRYYFNYIKTIECKLKGSLDNEIRNEIKGIYNNGITLWHYRDNAFKGINNYNYENIELTLIGDEE